jgi:2-polyprenyl-6-methoxyphenol hydroxylase-like FAD-dependent oxidoreductase
MRAGRSASYLLGAGFARKERTAMVRGTLGEHAVVIGAGVAGLASAGALRDRFERVTVLELDAFPPTAAHRNGTPQDRHTHGVLCGGLQALEEVFPGFAGDLERAGAVPLRVGYDLRYERPGFDSFPKRDFGWLAYGMSRPMIERVLRARVEQCANVTLRGRSRVREIVATPDGAAANGVAFEQDGRGQTLAADLVVEATGRGDLTVALLEALHGALPHETSLGVDLGYSTAVFEMPDDAPCDWKGVLCFPKAPQSSRFGILWPIEGHCWTVSLAGRFDDKPPGDPDGFMAFARSLRTPTIADALESAKFVSPVSRFGTRTCVRRDFSNLAGFPQGLIQLGDAICRFNPTYGQGMSVAAQEARLLRRLLDGAVAGSRGLAGVAPAFFVQAQTLLDAPWSMTTALDLAYPQTEGDRPADLEQRRRFGLALLQLAVSDPAVHKLTLAVQHLLEPQSVYGEPALVERVRAVIQKMPGATETRALSSTRA